MPDFTCQRCGEHFALPQSVLDRYPGWTPRLCRDCRDGGAAGAKTGAGGHQGDDQRETPRAKRGSVRRGGRRGRTLVEENLTLAEVLDKYRDGPQDGVFTDGSAHPNPGPGGWGAVYVVGGRIVDQDYGHEDDTTNNRMELAAVIAGFDLVPEGSPATLYSDSRLAVDTITKWAPGWQARGWRRKTGEVQNLDLVKLAYDKARSRPEIRLEWIAAHSGSLWNEYADSLSTAYLRDEL